MDEKDILTVLAEGTEAFSKRQRNVARYICDNSDKAAFMTAEMLSAAARVSESTVVRFAVELGFENYPEMRRAIQQVLRGRLAVLRSQAQGPGGASVLRVSLSDSAGRLQRLENEKNQRCFNGAAEALARCKNVYIVSNGSYAPLAQYLAYELDALRCGVHCFCDEVLSRLSHISRGDMLLCIAQGNSLSEALRLARDAEADITLVSSAGSAQELGVTERAFTAENAVELMGFMAALIKAAGSAERHGEV